MTNPSDGGCRRVHLTTGEPIDLAPVLARAGEGTVYGVVQRADWAAKVFHPNLNALESKLAKVAAMIESPPSGTLQPNGFVVLAWPTHVIVDDDVPVGFIMPRVGTATSVEIHTLSNPTTRQDPLPSAPQWTRYATWEHLVNTAANLCLAVQSVHRVNAVIGDFQERNILVSDTTEVTLVDCDSMQFTDRSGRQFLCGVGRPEFTAPELAGVELRLHARDKTSDLFALAIHIHQLLMAGNHPFMRGAWTGGGEQPDALTLARSASWAGGVDSPLRTHPLAPPVDFLPSEIQRLFERAFTDGAADPTRRPSAEEWRGALLRIRLKQCPRAAHQVPVHTLACPWCAIDNERKARKLQGQRGRQDVTAPRPIVVPGRVGPAAPATSSGNTKLILAGLFSVVIFVLVLTCFILWAVLSGASTFGL